MPTRKPQESEWRDYFTRFNSQRPSQEFRIEYLGQHRGDQIEAEWELVGRIEYLTKEREFHISSER